MGFLQIMVTPKIRAGILPRVAGLSLGLLSVLLSLTTGRSNEDVEAFWGSFGERNGRIEGVFLKAEESGLFIGFDEETEMGAYSGDVVWSTDGRFVFEGISMSKESNSVVPTKGEGRTLGLGSEALLESGFVDSDLKFESFAKSSARVERFQLEGEMGGELFLAFGSEGRSYALFIDSAGTMLGGTLSEYVSEMEFSFVTQRGDTFESEIGSAPRYSLADGRKGSFQSSQSVLSGSATEKTPVRLQQVWNSYSKSNLSPADGLHFIIEGEGVLPVELTAGLKIDLRDVGFDSPVDSALIEIFRADENEEWRSWLTSSPFSRIKPTGAGEFELWYRARLPTSLPRGTYLIRATNLPQLSLDVEMRAVFSRSQTIRAVNGSTFYYRDALNGNHRFGFELAGDGFVQTLVRSVGPGLGYFEVPDCTQDPSLLVYKDGLKSWKNEDWGKGVSFARIEDVSERLGAFPLPAGSGDAALVLSLAKGAYEIDCRRSADDPGFEIIEVYLDDL